MMNKSFNGMVFGENITIHNKDFPDKHCNVCHTKTSPILMDKSCISAFYDTVGKTEWEKLVKEGYLFFVDPNECDEGDRGKVLFMRCSRCIPAVFYEKEA